MKKVKSKFQFLAYTVMALTAIGLGSCSKSSSGGSTTPPPLGGYVSSDSVASSNLVLYWNFDGNANETKMGMTATSNAVTYTTGVRGQAYQGGTGAYATLAIPTADTAALSTGLGSYSISFWYKMPSQQPDGNPGGVFFLSGTNTLNELIYEFEHYAPVSGDSVNFHNGFTNLGSAGWQGFTMAAWDTSGIAKWVHLTATYDGTSSTYVVYENGTPIYNASAWGYLLSNILYQGANNPPGSDITQGPIKWTGDAPKTIYIGTWPPTLYGVSATLGANGCFLGNIDELRVFNKALSQQEVAGLFLNGQAGR